MDACLCRLLTCSPATVAVGAGGRCSSWPTRLSGGVGGRFALRRFYGCCFAEALQAIGDRLQRGDGWIVQTAPDSLQLARADTAGRREFHQRDGAHLFAHVVE